MDGLVLQARAAARSLDDEAQALREYVERLKAAPRPRVVEWMPIKRDQGDYFPEWNDG
jgi:hypothetical protein